MSSPKPLHEVLEEEYVSMYGPLERPASGDNSAQARLANVYSAIHERAADKKDPHPRTALCISGGGIRSATFALGVIQGLASASVLKKFDYLSTVSGGGYIGSWLSSWIRRHPDGVAGVQCDLQRTDSAITGRRPFADPAKKNIVLRDEDKKVIPREIPADKLDPEPGPVRHLREYSNYLSPQLGLLSGDTWTMASLYIRNLLLNLLVLVPLLALALAVPRLFSWGLAPLQRRALEVSTWPWVFVGLVTLGLAYTGWTRPVEQNRREKKKTLFQTSDGWYMALCIVPLTLAAAALAIFWARVQEVPAALTATNTIRAAAAAVVGMTIVPFLLYYTRYLLARRSTFQAKFWTKLGWKIAAEFGAVTAAVATSAALLYLLADKVFYDPLRATPELAKALPIARFDLASSPQAQLFVCFAVPAVLLVFFVQASIFVGLSGRKNEDYDREWWGRAGAWLLFFAVALGLVSFISVFGPVALYNAPGILASIGGGAGVAAAVLGFSDKTPANQKQKEKGGKFAAAGNFASVLMVPLFVVFLLAAISLGSTWLTQEFRPLEPGVTEADAEANKKAVARNAALQAEFTRTVPDVQAGGVSYEQKNKLPAAPLTSIADLQAAAHLNVIKTTTGGELGVYVAVALVAVILSYRIGVNRFSMAALYRNRLIRAYLGASNDERDPENFTGFDPTDNLQMWQLRPELLWAQSIPSPTDFVAALRKPEADRKTLADYLLEKLDATTTEAPVDGAALAGNLNHLLVKETFPEAGKVPWIQTKGIGYSQSFRNRAVLDHYFARWIRPMALPNGVVRTTPLDGTDALQGVENRPPLHIVNTALNLTTGDKLAWQQRQAESFTVSPYHCGNLTLGYRPAATYGGEEGISLGTAVGISGAAASPNMGYHSSPLMAFMLTFFNVRLGAWLGNPGPAGEKSYMLAHPSTSLKPMLDELTGSSNDRSKWVYLSDGGHFENLGLYEMVVRRCHSIIVSDAGADPKFSFEDLGNAIRKIRIDLGVPIDIESMEMNPRADDGTYGEGRYVARATIRYSSVDANAVDGTLIYIKAGIYKDPFFPRDVYNYAQESLLFPHEPTSDQFFSESQFESYRALGRHAVNEICANYESGTADTLIPIAKTFESVNSFVGLARQNTGKRPTTAAI